MSLFRSPRPTGVRRHDEGGSVIIIVMAFILVIGVIALALLSFSFTATKSQAVFRADRVIRNNAESALITTVERLRMNPLMATDANSSGTPPLDSACNLNFPMQEDTSNGTKATVTSTSVLQVTCGPTTPYNTSGTYGVQSGSGGVDADGGQRPRDVTITVTCKGERANVRNLVDCGTTGTARIVAQARVRFDIDPNVTLANYDKRAVVPKIVTWDIRR